MTSGYTIDAASDRPLFKQIADQIRAEILSGALAPADQLPGEGEIAQSCGVAIGTVKQALRLLQQDGLLSSERGRRWTVLPFRTAVADLYAVGQRNYAPDVAANFSYMHGVPWDEFDTRHEYRVVPAPERVARQLRIELGALVCERQWTHIVDGVIIRVGWSYVEMARFADTVLTNPDEPPWPGGTIAQLKSLGYDVRHVHEQVGQTAVDEGQARLLGVDPGTRVLSRWRTQYSGGIGRQTAQAVETAFHLFAKPDVELEYEIALYGRLD